jgi:hypothetical protein
MEDGDVAAGLLGDEELDDFAQAVFVDGAVGAQAGAKIFLGALAGVAVDFHERKKGEGKREKEEGRGDFDGITETTELTELFFGGERQRFWFLFFPSPFFLSFSRR